MSAFGVHSEVGKLRKVLVHRPDLSLQRLTPGNHDELLLAPYTTAQANAQINALPAEYGAQGKLAVTMIREYVRGINAYIAKAGTDPALLPVEYSLLQVRLKPWTPADVVAVAALIGGIFGDGGGGEVRNAALLKYLRGQLGQSAGSTAFGDFKEQNDPAAPTTVVGKAFPYEIVPPEL